MMPSPHSGSTRKLLGLYPGGEEGTGDGGRRASGSADISRQMAWRSSHGGREKGAHLGPVKGVHAEEMGVGFTLLEGLQLVLLRDAAVRGNKVDADGEATDAG